MMNQTAKQRAAIAVLSVLAEHPTTMLHTWSFGERENVKAELKLIEKWLTARACGGDKQAIRQLGKETGHQVKLPTRRIKGVR
jgi:hypothetical protein